MFYSFIYSSPIKQNSRLNWDKLQFSISSWKTTESAKIMKKIAQPFIFRPPISIDDCRVHIYFRPQGQVRKFVIEPKPGLHIITFISNDFYNRFTLLVCTLFWIPKSNYKPFILKVFLVHSWLVEADTTISGHFEWMAVILPRGSVCKGLCKWYFVTKIVLVI